MRGYDTRQVATSAKSKNDFEEEFDDTAERPNIEWPAEPVYENHPALVVAVLNAGVKTFSGKWKLPILWCLRQRPRRFTELSTLLPGITAKVLTYQLRDLARAGLISRVQSRAPRQTQYALTQSGKDSVPLLKMLYEWGTWQLRRSQ